MTNGRVAWCPQVWFRMLRPRPLRLAARIGPAVIATVLLALGGPALAQAQSTAASLGLLGDVAAVREYHRYADDDEARLRSERTVPPVALSAVRVGRATYAHATCCTSSAWPPPS